MAGTDEEEGRLAARIRRSASALSRSLPLCTALNMQMGAQVIPAPLCVKKPVSELPYWRSSGDAWWVVASVSRVREVADPKCRRAGQVDRAGFLSRPAVPSRARANCSCCVGDELSVDHI